MKYKPTSESTRSENSRIQQPRVATNQSPEKIPREISPFKLDMDKIDLAPVSTIEFPHLEQVPKLPHPYPGSPSAGIPNFLYILRI